VGDFIMTKAASILAGAALAVAVSLSASAQAAVLNPLLSISDPTGQSLGNGPFTLGWDFTVNSTITVNGLGVFDSGQDGLAESHAVGLWDSSGDLLASTTVGSGLSGTLVDQFRYNSIAPVTLSADQTYYVGAVWLDGADPMVFNATGLFTNPSITYNASAYVGGSSSLAFPSNLYSDTTGYFGPNISAVPEPSTWAMMLLGFAGLGFAGYHRIRKDRLALAPA
jgi:hypothetical protein